MQNMFSPAPWWNTKVQGVPGLGFVPGPIQVPLVNVASMQGFPAPMAPAPAPFRTPLPAPGIAQTPPGAVPMGPKSDCPVCRSFGGGF